MLRLASFALVGLLVVAGTIVAQETPVATDEPVFYGPQVGEKLPPFQVTGVFDDQAGKELEHKTFPDKEVIKAGGRFVAVKIDLTDDEDPTNAAIKKKYNIQGLPAVLLLDSSGTEVKRITEFVEPKVFLAALEQVK